MAVRSKAEAEMLLGLHGAYTRDDLDACWRELARECHPDKGGGGTMMARINAAKDLLTSSSTMCKRTGMAAGRRSARSFPLRDRIIETERLRGPR